MRANDALVVNDTESYVRGDSTTFDENNIVIGDHGFIDWTALDIDRGILHGRAYDLHAGDDLDATDIDRISTMDPTIGGMDDITSGAGNDLIFGGTSDDTVHAGAGNDLVFGDHGKVEAATTTTTVALSGALAPGQVWAITLSVSGDVGGVTETYVATYSYTVPALDLNGNLNETLGNVARGLASAINRDEALTSFVIDNEIIASVDGANVILVSRWNADFTTTFTHPATGTPVLVNPVAVPVSSVDADALPLAGSGFQDPFVYLAIDTQSNQGGGHDVVYAEDGEDIVLGPAGQ